VRIDHFRGFEAYWSVPATAPNARTGRWVTGPGIDFFAKVKAALPAAKLIAEDLGLLTPATIALREATGLPGMAVLQFAFGGDADNLYLPHNQRANTVVYPGTRVVGAAAASREGAGAGLHGLGWVRSRGAAQPAGVHEPSEYGDRGDAGCSGLGCPSTHEPAGHGERQLALAAAVPRGSEPSA